MHSLHKGQRVPWQRPPLKPKDGLNPGPPKVNIRFAQDASQAQHDAFPRMGVSKKLTPVGDRATRTPKPQFITTQSITIGTADTKALSPLGI